MKRYTAKGLRYRWRQDITDVHSALVSEGVRIIIRRTVGLRGPVRWYWALTVGRDVASADMPSAKTVVQAKGMAEEAALAWAKALVVTLEGR